MDAYPCREADRPEARLSSNEVAQVSKLKGIRLYGSCGDQAAYQFVIPGDPSWIRKIFIELEWSFGELEQILLLGNHKIENYWSVVERDL